MTSVLLFIFQTEIETPKAWSLFHLLWIGLVALATFLLVKFFGKCSDKTYRKIALIMWIIFLAFEIYKQIIFFWFGGDHGEIVQNPHYQWYIFPFQFCSTPFYILPFVAFMKDGKVRDAILLFCSTFVMIGGILVYLMPETVYIDNLGICIQTMMHHGMQIVFGVFTFVRYKEKFKLKNYPFVIAVFGVFVAIAIILNEIFFAIIPEDQTCNLFFINRHYETSLPVFNAIQPNVPYVVFVFLYVFAFSLGGFLLYSMWMGIKALSERYGKKAVEQE